ncbi:MAG TPA: ATP-dependent DNA helicase RecG [Bacteroidales bacterium]|nr:ATP-dependent DNA helicase RecG [Bacteroidales bacterium]MCZ2416878.1 ATP-dependent DNA helicase RecG [Burkholderiales bacterium]NLZ08977.1 ATP-dependent DNA helicase RecG [Bacteroidales bacterium]HNZ45841.1 ATP-dependent DNA helicase RecG [Bacteroidales bacterium]HOT54199.1 ATP-dependent DNA helicase RecG [Bacteroidales bacterium]
MTSVWDTNIQFLQGVGPGRARELEKGLNIKTFGDLIRHYPFRYIDRTRFYSISEIDPDLAAIQIRGEVRDMKIVGAGSRKQRLVVLFADPTGTVDLVFFKGIRWIKDKIKVNTEYIVFGKPTLFNGRMNLVHPDMDIPDDQSLRGSSGLQAVYSSTESLRDKGFTQKVFSRLIAQALNRVEGQVVEPLTPLMLKQLKLMPLAMALEEIHFPKNLKNLQAAQTRLKFEELFFIQLGLLKQRAVRLRAEDGLRFSTVGESFNNCYKRLPFELTSAQKRVIKEIRADLGSGRQMNRLLQGDVGSGKTLVALLSSLIATDNGYQACMMAPTEILANQHYNTVSRFLKGQNIKVGLLTGNTKASERKALLESLQDGSLHLLIGTHALIEDTVTFKKLGFVVIDEQHRFGVEQRARLWEKTEGSPPHILVMTATPIPRTLAMTLYGDLDVSVIDELPPGRQPVQTIHYPSSKRGAVYSFLKKQITEGRQVYIVYPLIRESEKMDYENLETGYRDITMAFPAPLYSVAVVHGQQKPEDKAYDMNMFVRGHAQILIATSVIEVGVDVPNATVMVIESAERFGLSQLHQLRGRVGRGAEKSYCILMTGNALSKEARQRLKLMCESSNGFEIAEADMRLRGPGDLEGTAQSGLAFDLHIASLAKDGQILEWARSEAQKILDDDPLLASEKNKMLRLQLEILGKRRADYSKIS